MELRNDYFMVLDTCRLFRHAFDFFPFHGFTRCPGRPSRHFKLFKDAGFVEEGGRTEYELAPEAVSAALGSIIDFIKGGVK